mmetsp:Transcript_13346/g.17111  ORF Transcript_13346/g.17111 Transcript_13346/m.17111 type:complete len:97 (-) Transcript_13346:2737-3027(-)
MKPSKIRDSIVVTVDKAKVATITALPEGRDPGLWFKRFETVVGASVVTGSIVKEVGERVVGAAVGLTVELAVLGDEVGASVAGALTYFMDTDPCAL